MDTDLVIRARSGDHGAFAEIVASVARRFHVSEGLAYVTSLRGDPGNTMVRGIIYQGPLPPAAALGAVAE